MTVFVSLGAKPEEPSHLRGRETYPEDVRARLAADAAEIIARYPVARSALLPLLHLVQAEDGCLTPAGVEFCAAQLGSDRRRSHRGRNVLLDVPARPHR